MQISVLPNLNFPLVLPDADGPKCPYPTDQNFSLQLLIC